MRKRLRRFLTCNRLRIEEARALASSAASGPEARVAASLALTAFEHAQSLLADGLERERRAKPRAFPTRDAAAGDGPAAEMPLAGSDG